jgi:ABC-type antimicrobial peptide transport system permease subunit
VSWTDAVRLAARSVLRRPGRAALTVVAVALAAALFTAMLTMAETARSRVLDQLSKGGPLAGIQVAAAAADPSQVDSDNPRPGAALPIDEAALRRIEVLPGVSTVLPVVTGESIVVWDDQAATPPSGTPSSGAPPDRIVDTMVGVNLARASQLPITVLSGRLPAPGSLTEVAVTPAFLARFGIGRKQVATAIGKEVELGAPRGFRDPDGSQRLRGRWVRAQVVGVVAQQAGSGGILASLQQAQAAHTWTAGGDLSADPDATTTPYSGLFVIAKGLDGVAKVRAEITGVGYSTSAPENLIATVQRYVRVVEIVLGGIGVIALAIAALGIANALLAAVRERRREIGVLKAVGARDRDVLRTFLIEAGVMGALGGLIGSILGLAVARAVAAVVDGYLTSQGLAGVQVGMPYRLGLAAVAGSVLLALLAGALPARRAARLPAREAVEL